MPQAGPAAILCCVLPDADHRIKLQVFEGPLDLLLFLIRKNELDIYDIPIESVMRQYMEVLHAMEDLQLEVAGEFFVMAATLMEIKSRLLLPKERRPEMTEEGDELEVDPRWELVHQLIQYRKFKEASTKLGDLAVKRQDMMERYISNLGAESGDRPLKSFDRIELWNAFNTVLRRLAERLVVGQIHDERVTVADRMEFLLARIKEKPRFVFTELFEGPVSIRMLIATFWALLELTRLKHLRLRQDETFGDIFCEAVTAPAAAPGPPHAAP